MCRGRKPIARHQQRCLICEKSKLTSPAQRAFQNQKELCRLFSNATQIQFVSKKSRNTYGAHDPGRPHKSVFSKLGAIALTAALLYSANAYAENPSSSMFSFSGFGTLGLTHSSEDDAEFVAHKLQPSGAGHSQNWSADVD